ncbi:hypothetical protein [Cohnella caldifontis]|uniref:hypothetical protein n=1 Tax=Cohnella caldifontis TaxID=3027471 RepID=UPI0023EDAA24|nr:hypothetical protein [Cohnella sp. YIM B05605]
MSIKTRLVFSYLAMTFIPVLLFALIAGLLSSNWKDGSPDSRHAYDQREEWIAGLAFLAETEPDRFADPAFLAKADERLRGLQAGLVVTRNGNRTFASPGYDATGLNGEPSDPGNGSERRPWGWDHGMAGRDRIRKMELAFGDGSTGAAYVISGSERSAGHAGTFFLFLVLTVLAKHLRTASFECYHGSANLFPKGDRDGCTNRSNSSRTTGRRSPRLR